MHAGVKKACQKWWWLSPKFNTGSAPICSEPFLTLRTVHITNVARTLGNENQGCPTDSSLHTLLPAVSSPRLDYLVCVKENVYDRNAEGASPRRLESLWLMAALLPPDRLDLILILLNLRLYLNIYISRICIIKVYMLFEARSQNSAKRSLASSCFMLSSG
jgi:hypothetical protein